MRTDRLVTIRGFGALVLVIGSAMAAAAQTAPTSAATRSAPAQVGQRPPIPMRPPAAPGATHQTFGVAFKVAALTGFGIEGAHAMTPKLNLRAGFNFFDFNHTFVEDDQDIDVNARLRSFTTHVDWFPFGGGFHVSPALMLYHGNRVRANAVVGGGESFDLDGREYFSDATDPARLHLDVGWKRVAPGLTVGWGNLIPKGSRRWSVPFEVGGYYIRPPQVSMTAGGTACDRSGRNCRNLATDPTLQQEVRDEEAKARDEAKILRFLPVVSIGFSYKF